MSDWKSDSSGWSQPAQDGGAKDSFSGTEGGDDSVQEHSSVSWFDRIKRALAGVMVGILLIPGSCYLLFWNEGRAVTTARSLAEGEGAVRRVAPGAVDAAHEGHLVYVTGPLRVTGELRDPTFPVTATGATRLVRAAEMYQWREESRTESRNRVGGGQENVTTYSYSRVWSANPYDSSRFRNEQGHQNPRMAHRSNTVTAESATLGAFRLNQDQLRNFGNPQQIPLDANNEAFRRPNVHIVDGALYLGPDPANPRVGDLRVTFSRVQADVASVVARQIGNGFGPYQTRAGDAIQFYAEGTVPPETLFRAAQDQNRILTWILRAVGLIVMAIGFTMIMAPLGVLADILPIFGSIVRFGTGLIAFALTFVLGPLVIAVAWFAYRPIVAGIVVAVGLVGAFGMSVLARRRAAARAAQAAPPPQPQMPVQSWGR